MKSWETRQRMALLPLTVLLAFATSFARSQEPTAPEGGLSGDKIQCANLTYAGNKTSKCFSDRFLQRLSLETRIQTEDHFRQVRLDARDLCNYPFSIMTGEGSFSLTEKERVQLRYYLTHGGFLLASAGCSSPEWVQSFRREFAKVFPGRQLIRLKLDHPLFRTVYKIDTLRTTHGTHGADGSATLEAYEVKGRVVMVFSSDGLNDTAHSEGCCCCGGDEIDKSEFINVDVLAYALLH